MAHYEVHRAWQEHTGQHVKEHLFAIAKSDIEQDMYVTVAQGETHEGVQIAVAGQR